MTERWFRHAEAGPLQEPDETRDPSLGWMALGATLVVSAAIGIGWVVGVWVESGHSLTEWGQGLWR